MPRVSVATPAASAAKRFDTNARTWGELKPEIERQQISLAGVEAIMRPGNVTLTRNDAELPREDFKIFLVATKNKAGATLEQTAKSIGDAVAAGIVKGARIADANKLKELKDTLIEEIEGFFDVDFDSDDVDFDEDFPVEEDEDVAEARRMSRD